MKRLRRDSRLAPPFPGRVLPREQWSRTRVGLGERGKPFDWGAAFAREAPRALDLGCGNGRWLIASALQRPGVDHLGIELVPAAVRLGSLRAGQRGLANLKFAWGDASEFLVERCPAASVAEVHLYHPQPYYDASKRARRQLHPEVLLAIHRVLQAGGTFVFQTDNPAFADYARRIVPALFEWSESADPWPDAPQGRTLREIVARSKGLPIVRARCRRRELELPEAERIASALPGPDFDANRPQFRGFGGKRRPALEGPRRRRRTRG
jgi:tRNA (guanine-N7-)-methyltransferase